MTARNGWTILAAFAVALGLVLGLSFVAKGQEIRWAAGRSFIHSTASEQTEADVKVTTILSGGRVGNGSGTAIAPHPNGTVILTNHHVIEGGTSFRVCVNGSCHYARLLGSDSQNDVALLLVPVRVKYATLGTTVPSGVMAQFRGFDSGTYFRVWRGRILGFEYDSYLADTYSVGGNSGGGVYVNGQLVGVIWGNRGNPGKLAFTGVGPIRKLLARVGVGIAAPYPEQIIEVPQPAPPKQPDAPPAQCPACDCDEKIAKLVDLQADLVIKVQKLEAKVNTIEAQPGPQGPAGPPGERGPQGEPGPAGEDGKDADTKAINAKIDALEKELAALRDKKFRVYTHTPYGVFDSEPQGVGEDIHIQYVPAE